MFTASPSRITPSVFSRQLEAALQLETLDTRAAALAALWHTSRPHIGLPDVPAYLDALRTMHRSEAGELYKGLCSEAAARVLMAFSDEKHQQGMFTCMNHHRWLTAEDFDAGLEDLRRTDRHWSPGELAYILCLLPEPASPGSPTGVLSAQLLDQLTDYGSAGLSTFIERMDWSFQRPNHILPRLEQIISEKVEDLTMAQLARMSPMAKFDLRSVPSLMLLAGRLASLGGQAEPDEHIAILRTFRRQQKPLRAAVEATRPWIKKYAEKEALDVNQAALLFELLVRGSCRDLSLLINLKDNIARGADQLSSRALRASVTGLSLLNLRDKALIAKLIRRAEGLGLQIARTDIAPIVWGLAPLVMPGQLDRLWRQQLTSRDLRNAIPVHGFRSRIYQAAKLFNYNIPPRTFPVSIQAFDVTLESLERNCAEASIAKLLEEMGVPCRRTCLLDRTFEGLLVEQDQRKTAIFCFGPDPRPFPPAELRGPDELVCRLLEKSGIKVVPVSVKVWDEMSQLERRAFLQRSLS